MVARCGLLLGASEIKLAEMNRIFALLTGSEELRVVQTRKERLLYYVYEFDRYILLDLVAARLHGRARALRLALQDELRNHGASNPYVVLDFHAVRSIGAEEMRALAGMDRQLRRRLRALFLIGVQPPVRAAMSERQSGAVTVCENTAQVRRMVVSQAT